MRQVCSELLANAWLFKGHPECLLQVLKDVLLGLTSAVPGILLVSVLSMLILIGGKMVNERFKSKLPFAIPWELVLVSDSHAHTHTHTQQHQHQ